MALQPRSFSRTGLDFLPLGAYQEQIRNNGTLGRDSE